MASISPVLSTMDAVLEKLSKQELILLLNAERKAAEEKVKLQAKQQEVDYLKAKVAQLQRMLFGQKRERFTNPDQLLLPFSPSKEQNQQQKHLLKRLNTSARRSRRRLTKAV